MTRLTSKIALDFVTRIEALNAQISAVYREVGDIHSVGDINAIREIVEAREAAADRQFEAEGLLAALDLPEEE